MLRAEYWAKSKELIDWANDTELSLLSKAASKELEKRHNAYFKKFDIDEAHGKKVKARKAKDKYRKKAKSTNTALKA